MDLTATLRATVAASDITQPMFRKCCPRRLLAQAADWEREDGFVIPTGRQAPRRLFVNPGAPSIAADGVLGKRYGGYRSAMAYGAAGAMGLFRPHGLHGASQLFDSLNIAAPALVPIVFGVPSRPRAADLTVMGRLGAGCLFVVCVATVVGLVGTRQTPLANYGPLDEEMAWLDKVRRLGILGLLSERLDVAAQGAQQDHAALGPAPWLLGRLALEVPIQVGLVGSAATIGALAVSGALLGAIYCSCRRLCFTLDALQSYLRGRPAEQRVTLAEAELMPQDRAPNPVIMMEPPGVLFGHVFANQLVDDIGGAVDRQHLASLQLPRLPRSPATMWQLNEDFFPSLP